MVQVIEWKPNRCGVDKDIFFCVTPHGVTYNLNHRRLKIAMSSTKNQCVALGYPRCTDGYDLDCHRYFTCLPCL